jgi:hypothetical protein
LLAAAAADKQNPEPTKREIQAGQMQLRELLVLGLALLAPIAAEAGEYSAGNILPHCTSLDSFCIGYILAVVDAENERPASRDAGAAGKQFCVPKGVDVDQLSAIFVKYASARPDQQSHSAARLVRASLIEKYPCR